jgi:GxxExxY protein
MTYGELFDERLTHSVIGAFYEVYNVLGFGLYESVYAAALAHELVARGHRVEREVRVVVTYKGLNVGVQRIDMIVDGRLVVETKSTLELHGAWKRQVASYLNAGRRDIGLLLHFGAEPRAHRISARQSTDTKRMG